MSEPLPAETKVCAICYTAINDWQCLSVSCDGVTVHNHTSHDLCVFNLRKRIAELERLAQVRKDDLELTAADRDSCRAKIAELERELMRFVYTENDMRRIVDVSVRTAQVKWENERKPHEPSLLALSIENTARWLENGCDPQSAAQELRIISSKMRSAHEPEALQACPECPLGDGPACNEQCETGKFETQPAEQLRCRLPKITQEIVDDWILRPPLIELDEHGKYQWTQEAVDIACMFQGSYSVPYDDGRPPHETGEPR